MKLDFESLSAEPLFYMLMHSGVFVFVLGCVFFTIGLLFGRATWGRYKRQARLLDGEVVLLKGEIADLKRKLADHLVKGESVAIATETIHMPPKESAQPAPAPLASEQSPAPAAKTTTEPQGEISSQSKTPHARAHTIKPKKGGERAVVPVTKSDEKASPPVEATVAQSETPTTPEPTPHASPLAEIIAATPPGKQKPKKKESAAAASSAEKSSADNHVSAVQAVLDAKLGMIYPTKPEEVDDLTALKGIGKGLEQRLHELGVYTYAQIALWTEDQVAEYSSRLAFKDRIQREHWVAQAQGLLGKKSAKKAP